MMPVRPKKGPMLLDEAHTIGLQALGFLAEDEARIGRFMALTGLSAEDLQARATSSDVLQAVLEHLLENESLLLVFAAQSGIKPDEIQPAWHVLSGAQ